jgi:hypothetical protein
VPAYWQGGPPVAVGLTDRLGAPLATDAFDNLRVTQKHQLFDNYHKYEIDLNEWGVVATGGGVVSHLPDESSAKIEVSSADGARAMIRQHTYNRYQAGRGIGTKFTIIHGDAPTSLSLVRRTSTSGAAVDNEIARTSWTHDRVDRDISSSFALDVTRGNIYGIDIAWLGVAGARFFVNNHLVHLDDHLNRLTTPYMTSATLPLTYEIVNSGAYQYRRWGYFDDRDGYFYQSVSPRAAGHIKNICSSAWSDGGSNGHGFSFAALGSATIAVGTATALPLMSIRPKLLYNSITNRSVVLPVRVVASAEAKPASIAVVYNPTLTGGAWVSADATSGVEYNSTATAITGGSVLYYDYVPADGSVSVDVSALFSQLGRKLRLDHTGTVQDVVAIRGIAEAAVTANMRASMSWLESR